VLLDDAIKRGDWTEVARLANRLSATETDGAPNVVPIGRARSSEPA
jgi:hypothetical protein